MAEAAPAYIAEERCAHPITELRYRLNVRGYKMFTRQCMECGEYASDWIKTASLSGEEIAYAMPIDESIWAIRQAAQQDIWRENRKRELEAIEAKRGEEKAARRDQYNEYLQTPEWFERRAKVLKRANGLCEGCGTQRATQVHHLTYANIGHEMLWQLVAVCSQCHKEVHGKDE